MAADDLDCSSFFDHIDDLLDIPDEACNSGNAETDFNFGDFKDFPSIWTQSDTFHDFTPKFVVSENNTNSASGLSDDVSVPYEDIAQLEWLSTFVEDSFSAGNSLTIDVPNSVVPILAVSPSPNLFHTTSPVSVLESSGSSYAAGKFMPLKPAAGASSGGRCGRARSDRPRPPAFNRRLVSPSASFTMAEESLEGGKTGTSEGESFGELCNSSKIRKSAASGEHKKKKKKVKLSVPVEVDQNDNPNDLLGGAVRKCQHCEITKTPQWRTGPNGPKTLCNACGVRYKSGRLFPEYRPAASPTFVPSIHSNSHKKVLEMRVKTTCNQTSSPLIEDSHTKNRLLVDYM